MRIISPKKNFFTLFISSISIFCLHAQTQNSSVTQDPKFEQLLNEKRKINTSLNINDSFKIQIFNGSSDKAKQTLADFKQNFADIDATIVFNTPNYKVWVGNFKTRIEAERNLIEIKKVYTIVNLIKPSR